MNNLGQQTPYSLECCKVAADGYVRGDSTFYIEPTHVHVDRSVECVGTYSQRCRGPIVTMYQSRLHATGMDPIPCK